MQGCKHCSRVTWPSPPCHPVWPPSSKGLWNLPSQPRTTLAINPTMQAARHVQEQLEPDIYDNVWHSVRKYTVEGCRTVSRPVSGHSARGGAGSAASSTRSGRTCQRQRPKRDNWTIEETGIQARTLGLPSPHLTDRRAGPGLLRHRIAY
ncbi:uncharacterized protein B0I36DRAFT_65535 [Microdochium trichocladiopsis]|uniref:Uncharacterized protein n=1 Tax=Microdochium trichocladiopsis TaxID=1682393 RepID=A0A9P8YG77_9PEZI|nr:uncharacterized protein B0I36DRAFT_65535 [Microdochium trichocladiopsis]KAH7037404.1 hypothetical protein B0I36DRAFT_65535 [Microdochium trichocladiopsis]